MIASIETVRTMTQHSSQFPILLLRRPDLWPTMFGDHEVWHGFTVLAAALHFRTIALLVV